MRRIALVILLGFLLTPVFPAAYADEASEPVTTIGHWKLTGAVTGGASFTSYKDWQLGDEDIFTANGILDFGADYTRGRLDWANAVKLEYGMTRTDSNGSRKAADKLLLSSVMDYRIVSFLGAYLRFSGDTTVDKTYKYYEDDVNADLPDGQLVFSDKIKLADAFEPINLEEGIGVAGTFWKDADDLHHLVLRLGMGGRHLIASDYFLEADIEDTRVTEYREVAKYDDYGMEAGLDFKWTLVSVSNALITSEASAFRGIDKEFWKVNWTTALSVALTKYFGLSLSAEMLLDELVYDDPQWKTNTLLTLTYRLF